MKDNVEPDEYAATTAGDQTGEWYVGSTAHIHDVQTVAAAAPEALHADFRTYLDFLSSGFIDPANPETNVGQNWPAPVQRAIAAITGYDSANCRSWPWQPFAGRRAHCGVSLVDEGE